VGWRGIEAAVLEGAAMLPGFKKLNPDGSPIQQVQPGVFEVKESYSKEYDFYRSYEDFVPQEPPSIKVGDRMPHVRLRCLTADGVREVTTDEVFGGKKVVVFGEPGAFTPRGSSHRLPGYLSGAEALASRGVKVACVSVNDPFVMDAWGREHQTEGKVMMLADGNAEFTRAIGLKAERINDGMGIRSKRYAMVVEDGVVTAVKVEGPSGFDIDISSVEAMLTGR
jgi:glutaredoxin/glutathione-dependent peroxiredoxin